MLQRSYGAVSAERYVVSCLIFVCIWVKLGNSELLTFAVGFFCSLPCPLIAV